ncbi:phosphodiesterase [Bacillus sp. HMF5848]|uniref:sensor domain-containing protein n=1 Tax=Bacillus sp. HMF5848 TaxID=2495421 RepID=UPI000F79057E|nr:GGDEF domain-containing phosphodiesterase [Bacillus sp. HMF5848]RSK26385.1 phosphodiesterase [Bacillus sp. HMF5848]
MMWTKTIIYSSQDALREFLQNHQQIFKKSSSTFVQVYTPSKKYHQGSIIRDYIMTQLPQAVVNEFELEDWKNSIHIAFSVFDETASYMKLEDQDDISEQMFKSLFEHNKDAVLSLDVKGTITSVNKSVEDLINMSADEIIGKSILDFIPKKEKKRVTNHFLRTLAGKEQSYEIDLELKKDTYLYLEVKYVPILVNSNKIGVFAIVRNVTEQTLNKKKITQLAYYDRETQLPNRTCFEEEISKRIKQKDHFSVMFVDMDRFKLINDSLGHSVGDQLLKILATRMQGVLPKYSKLGRFGGDKFIVLLAGKNVASKQREENITIVCNAILEKIAEPLIFQEDEFFITASIGVSVFPADGEDVRRLFRNAEVAMNRAKANGGNRFEFFADEMSKQAKQRLELEKYLRRALSYNELFLVYQPLVDMQTGKVIANEALVRWQHPKLGVVPPSDFIPLAEETGIIQEIGRWVLEKACLTTKRWQEQGYADLVISVNVSAFQFQNANFPSEVKEVLQTTKLAPEYLILELTESTMMSNLDQSVKVMMELKKIGVRVSVDDFGTGYSSLSYLPHLPISKLKIDKSFVQNLQTNPANLAIVQAIITMGEGLALKVVAEGVETSEQMQQLKSLHCHYAQGFHIQKPLKEHEAVQFFHVIVP